MPLGLRVLTGVASALTSLFLHACIISGDKCGPHQSEVGEFHTFCACDPGWVVADDGRGCKACREHEHVVSDRCVCEEGYARGASGGSCEPASIGQPCGDDEACSEPYAYCVTANVDIGYCTASGCDSDVDCPSGWSCETRHDPHYCARPPTGFGMSCQSDTDCADYEASYCEAFASHTCALAGCAEGAVTCPSSWTCCDYSALLGSALSLCLTADELTDSDCPRGGRRIAQ